MLRNLFLAAVAAGSLLVSATTARAQAQDPFSSRPHGDTQAVAVPDRTLAKADADLFPTLFAKGTFSTGLFDLRRLAYERPAIDAAFPNLRGDFEVLRPHSKTYNCIAWSLGISSQWVWPGDRIAAFDKLNAGFGYKRLKKADLSLVPGVEKIVLYAKLTNGRLSVTHQARQMADGTWTSKLGQMPLIRHRAPDAVDNASYGQPVAVYARRSER